MGLARKQRAAEAGALEAVVEAMRAHPQAAGVQEQGRAVEAGAIEHEAVVGPIIVICRVICRPK